jgi:diacylglycerol kinase (ATP)
MEGGTGTPLVIVNPTASRLADPVRRARVVEGLVAAVEARTGRTPTLADSTADVARAALAAATDAPLVAVAGGDGTIRETAAALSGSGVPLAIVPAGTGNVFAAALGIPRRTSDAVRLIETADPARIDLGTASWGASGAGHDAAADGSMTFGVACGTGFDARVMAAATTELKHRLGFLAYVVATMREAARLRPSTFEIVADDEHVQVTGLVVLIANCGQLIPGLVGPREPIDPTDGLLDVFVVTAGGVAGGIAGAAESLLAAGALPQRRRLSLRFRGRRIRVHAKPPEPVQVDGDAHEADWLEGTVVPGALTVLRP